ncbi:MAG: hypothetical protein ACI857_002971 [Arenicella sp.]|jgi:hypothetical protein
MNENNEKLLEHCDEYATELLKGTGESYPFGAYLDTIDNVHPLEMEFDPKQMPKIGAVMEKLTKYCNEELEAKRMNAFAICYEVEVAISEEEKLTCIAIDITNPAEETPLFYLPYTTTEMGVGVQEMFAVKR